MNHVHHNFAHCLIAARIADAEQRRTGHRVTVIERDDTPMPDDVEGAFEWNRRGAPQVQHPHAFLGLARTILRDRFPDAAQARDGLMKRIQADIGVRLRPFPVVLPCVAMGHQPIEAACPSCPVCPPAYQPTGCPLTCSSSHVFNGAK